MAAAKPIIKALISGRMVSSGISDDVVIASVYSEKTHLKKLINKSLERTVFGSCQKLTSTMKLRPEKCECRLQSRELPEVL